MILKGLYGVQQQVPETDEEGWDTAVTGTLCSLIDGLDGISCLGGTPAVPFPRFKAGSAAITVDDNDTLAPNNPLIKIRGDGAAATLSVVESIADGAYDGQMLTLEGLSDTYPVTIPDASNVKLWGTLTLGQYEQAQLRWDTTAGMWLELSRSNPNRRRDQGTIDFYEAKANGSNKVSLRAPASLAADYILTLPGSLGSGGFLNVGGDGVIALAAGTSTLDSAYESGRTITADLGGIAINGTSGITEAPLIVHQAANYPLFDLHKTGTGAGAMLDLTNDGTGYDIDGNASNWFISKLGTATLKNLSLDAASGNLLTFSNGGSGYDMIGSGVTWSMSKLGVLQVASIHTKESPVYDVITYGADPTGTNDSSSAIQAAITAAATNGGIVTGINGTYHVHTQISVTAGVELRDITLQAGTDGMNVVRMYTGSKFRGKIIGTGHTSIIERGIYAIDVSDIEINAEISQVTLGIHLDISSTGVLRSVINSYIHDILGANSDGLGLGVTFAGSKHCTGNIIAKNIGAHALYLNNGASYNDVYIDVDTCGNDAIVCYSPSPQPSVEFNTIKGKVVGLYKPGGQPYEPIGATISHNSNYNTIELDMTGGAGTYNFVRIAGPSGGPYPIGNSLVNSHMYGQCVGSACILVQNAEYTFIANNLLNGYATTYSIGVIYSGTHVENRAAIIRGNVVDCMGENCTGIYYEVSCDIQGNNIYDTGTSPKINANLSPAGDYTYGDIHASGGYRQAIEGWFQDNIAKSQSAAVLERYGKWTTGGVFTAIRPGSITGIGVRSNANITAGTATVIARIDGTPTALSAILSSTNPTLKYTIAPKDLYAFTSGQILSITLTTDAGLLPDGTAELEAWLEIEC